MAGENPVTPEEIRAIQQNPYPVKGELTLNDATFYVLREIAAQLAEQNQQFRDDTYSVKSGATNNRPPPKSATRLWPDSPRSNRKRWRI
jgi:hypothetical protein